MRKAHGGLRVVSTRSPLRWSSSCLSPRRSPYDELLREANTEHKTKRAREPAYSVRMWLARALVRLAIALVPGGGSGEPQASVR